ncbi:MAG: hypothetical protein GX616_05020 [Planctomycetes bacterium]|nr:hypothetical protein [Planctomycetota bacterium]
MRREQLPSIGLLAVLGAAALTYAQTPVGSGFTYQGQLKSGGAPYTGTADMQFTLYDAAVAGNIVAGPIVSDNVQVANGLFTTTLDFGADAFNGEARWLQLAVVTPAGGGAYTPLDPRQAVRPAPYAVKVPGIDGYSLNAVDGAPADAVYVNGDGYVGIGTQNPLAPLHIEGPTGITDLLLKRKDATYGFSLAVSTTPKLFFTRTDGIAYYTTLVIDGPTGNVGIGADSPWCPLHVESTQEMGVCVRNTAATGNTFGLLGRCLSPDGKAVCGMADAESGIA